MTIPTPTVPGVDAAAAARWRDGLESELRRRRRARTRVLALSGSAVAASGATALAFVLASPGVSYAFGGWSPTPTHPTAAEMFSGSDGCVASPTSIQDDGPPTASVVDTRGPFTLSYFVTTTSGFASMACVTGPAFAHPWVVGARGVAAPSVAAGAVDLNPALSGSVDGQAYTVVSGEVGAGVTGVTIALSDGTSVVATVGDGLAVAWWPGAATVASTQASTS